MRKYNIDLFLIMIVAIFIASHFSSVEAQAALDKRNSEKITDDQLFHSLPKETANLPEQSIDFSQTMSQDDIELIALVTMAEAEGECEEGKRLVIDTILNRVDSAHFPNTVQEVIYQPHQFTSMWNGRADRCEVRQEICELVREELNTRLNSECVFFMAGRYSRYGVPLFQVENHYFSKYA